MKMNPLLLNLLKLRARIDRFTPRETIMVTVTLATVIVGFSYLVWLQPLEQSLTKTSADIADKSRMLTEARRLIDKPAAAQDPNADRKGKLETLIEKLRTTDAMLAEETQRLTRSANAIHIVERALANYPRISLEEFSNEPPQLVLKNEDALTKDLNAAVRALIPGGEILLFQHTFHAIVRGPYRELVNYLHKLEQTSNQLFIGEIALETQEYPQSRLSIELITLSPTRSLFDRTTASSQPLAK